MATIKTSRLSKGAIERLKLLEQSNEDFRFGIQKFEFPLEHLPEIAMLTNCRKVTEYNLSEGLTISILYSVQNDSVKCWGETEYGFTFSFTMSELDACKAIVGAGLACEDSGYLKVNDGETSYSVYDFCEGNAPCETFQVAAALFTVWLLKEANEADFYAEYEPFVLHPLAQVAAA